jgi:sorbitol-specific phosphotransferase system component IIBC
VIAVDHDFAFESTWQLEIVEKTIARVVLTLAGIAISIANVVSAIARVALFLVRARTTAQFDPRHLDVADVVVTITRIEVIGHLFTSEAVATRNSASDG